MKPSTFKANKVLIVSSRVSPFSIEELEGEKSSTLKPKDFAACSNDSFVLVLGSQNNKQTVFPLPVCSRFGQDSLIFCADSNKDFKNFLSRSLTVEILFMFAASQYLLLSYCF